MPFIDYNSRTKFKIWDGIYGSVAHSDKATYCHFTIEDGTILPEHSHVHEQWCHVIEGELEFDIAGEKSVLRPGMSAFIPSWAPHSARALTACKVIDCFTPAREDFIELERKAAAEE
ncbi:cupin domain-containing protein [Dyadobacter luteus]|uniref:Cupin domain-containing protein n=1 Tax=Dyadobacter luteus TaxID=2259619 RepID=A0A3D8Y918_9BACT|nr:cupin domain-containing protein [Dyadobacter luteus]REA57922.1 cupin domain-containing protein [Dyadobacter luteus]